eukprot:5445553-Amphidinium_carterae.1
MCAEDGRRCRAHMHMNSGMCILLSRFFTIDDVPGCTICLPRQHAGFGICKTQELLRGLSLTGLKVLLVAMAEGPPVVPQ